MSDEEDYQQALEDDSVKLRQGERDENDYDYEWFHRQDEHDPED